MAVWVALQRVAQPLVVLGSRSTPTRSAQRQIISGRAVPVNLYVKERLMYMISVSEREGTFVKKTRVET